MQTLTRSGGTSHRIGGWRPSATSVGSTAGRSAGSELWAVASLYLSEERYTADMTPTAESVTRRVASVLDLRDGWKGAHSYAPTSAAKSVVKSLHRRLGNQTRSDAIWIRSCPFPTVDGGVHFEWDQASSSVSIDIHPDGAIEVDVFNEAGEDWAVSYSDADRVSGLLFGLVTGVQ